MPDEIERWLVPDRAVPLAAKVPTVTIPTKPTVTTAAAAAAVPALRSTISTIPDVASVASVPEGIAQRNQHRYEE
ncbi:hypothetical protein GCM10009663_13900 [Kitasatospora arboriphila]|uniref:Uncharacterized protein n=1 Tax=Kitasatospora arboriphila TaxID=258052 RepID=A0ABN1TC53_9ACTN